MKTFKRWILGLAVLMGVLGAALPNESVSAHSTCTASSSGNHKSWHFTSWYWHEDSHDYQRTWDGQRHYHWWAFRTYTHYYVVYRDTTTLTSGALHPNFDYAQAECHR